MTGGSHWNILFQSIKGIDRVLRGIILYSFVVVLSRQCSGELQTSFGIEKDGSFILQARRLCFFARDFQT